MQEFFRESKLRGWNITQKHAHQDDNIIKLNK